MRTKEQIIKVFAERLKELMQEKGLNNTTLAAKLNLPRTTINGWTECKKLPRVDALEIVAEFFAVSLDYLLGREN